jgi:hypothetical protein
MECFGEYLTHETKTNKDGEKYNNELHNLNSLNHINSFNRSRRNWMRVSICSTHRGDEKYCSMSAESRGMLLGNNTTGVSP